MVKAYLRYEQRDAFGVVAGGSCSLCFTNSQGTQLVAAALETARLWDVKRVRPSRQLQRVSSLPSSTSQGVARIISNIQFLLPFPSALASE